MIMVEKKEPPVSAYLLTILVVFGAGIPLRGYALQMLWLWFVVPLGVGPLGIAHALGLSALAYLMVATGMKTEMSDKKGYEFIGAALGSAILIPLMAIAFGAIYRGLM